MKNAIVLKILILFMLRLYYTYSILYVGLGRKNTEVKQYGPRLAFGWVTIQGLDVDAVATNTVLLNPRSGETGPQIYAIYKNKK